MSFRASRVQNEVVQVRAAGLAHTATPVLAFEVESCRL